MSIEDRLCYFRLAWVMAGSAGVGVLSFWAMVLWRFLRQEWQDDEIGYQSPTIGDNLRGPR